MFNFLIQGLLRDRHRSLFPVIIVSLGVFLTTGLYSYMNGVFIDMIDSSARFDTGYIKVRTLAFDEIADQAPNDLAIANTADVIDDLNAKFPSYDWVPRIKFGGLLDIPDEKGETRDQGPVMGLGVHLLDPAFGENERMKIEASMVRGKYPSARNEILISEELSQNMNVNPGDLGTLVGSTANGAMAIHNFIIAGTVNFGVGAMDRGTIIADIEDVRYALDMMGMSSEIIGLEKDMFFSMEVNDSLCAALNDRYLDENDPFSLIARTLPDQSGLGAYLAYAETAGVFIVTIFLAIMAVILWNTSLMGGIRRYGEVGVRLAIGETKSHVFRSMLWESVFIGFTGSIIGTALGLALAWYLQEVGIDISSFMDDASMMMNNIIRAHITPTSYYIGFIPGLFATVLGTIFAGYGIYKRQTAYLFKELEV